MPSAVMTCWGQKPSGDVVKGEQDGTLALMSRRPATELVRTLRSEKRSSLAQVYPMHKIYADAPRLWAIGVLRGLPASLFVIN